MTCIYDKRNERPAFYVVQFLELPFEDIDPYVIVPYTWVIVGGRGSTQKSVIAYPNDENPDITRVRVIMRENWQNDWRFYIAIIKYESHTYADAVYWIVRGNDSSRATVTQPQLSLKETSHTANETPKLKEQTYRKRLKRNETGLSSSMVHNNTSQSKQTALPIQSDTKRLKRDEAAQSSNTAYSDEDTRSIECEQTKEIAADSCRKSSTSQPKAAKQPEPVLETQISVSSVPTQKPDDKITSATAAQNPSNLINQAKSLSTYSVEERSSVVTRNRLQDSSQVLEMHTEDLTGPSKKTTNCTPKMQQVPRVNVERSQDVTPVDSRNNPENITNVTPASQNVASSSQNQGNQQELVKGPTDNNKPNSRAISWKTSPIRQNYTQQTWTMDFNPWSISDNSETSPAKQSHPNKQELQRKSERPVIPVDMSFIPQNNSQIMSLQEGTNKTPPPIVSNILDSIQKVITSTDEQQIEVIRSESLPIIESIRNVMDTACQTDECRVEKPLTTSDSYADHEISTNDPQVDAANNVFCTEITSNSSSADKPTAAQYSTLPNCQTQPRTVVEQQMLDNVVAFFTQMGPELQYTCFNSLRNSIRETAESCTSLLNDVERFHTLRNSVTSKLSPTKNQRPDFPQASEKRLIELTARSGSFNENESCNNTVDRPLKEEYSNSWQFVLPPNYDANDTRWTLKYPFVDRSNSLGIEELLPGSDIYVAYGTLWYIKQVSNRCKSLASRLLLEVFNRPALSVCLTMTEKAEAANNDDSNGRPKLDKNASDTLLRFVINHGSERGWNVDLKSILATLHHKMLSIRSKTPDFNRILSILFCKEAFMDSQV